MKSCKPQGRIVGRARRAIAFFCCFALFSLPVFPQTRPTEYQVEAAYLYNFGKFVNFPVGSRTGTDFSVCILGEDPFGSTIDQTVAKAKIDGKPIVTRRIARAGEAQGCRIVFISESETGRLRTILPLLSKSGMLTVSDLPRFAERGGMIQFVMEGDRVRFEVNLGAAQQAGLNLSSELLKVAVKVTGGQRGQ